MFYRLAIPGLLLVLVMPVGFVLAARLGIPHLFLFAVFVVLPVVLVGIAWSFWRWLRHLATRGGYATVGEYLRTPPRSDQERQDSVDMALKGMVICLLGMIFPPAVLLGIFPLFFGARKLAYAWMGLGLVDDAEPPRG